MRKFTKALAAIIAATTMTVGMCGMTSSATAWSSSHVNVPGAPSSESTIDEISVMHGMAGATAICNYNSHSSSKATTGYTYINCKNYAMSQVVITKTGAKTCKPNVGHTLEDISVRYSVMARTPTSNDVFWSKGSIVKN